MREAAAVTLVQVDSGLADLSNKPTAMRDVLHHDERLGSVTRRPESLIGWCGTEPQLVTVCPARKRWCMGDRFHMWG